LNYLREIIFLLGESKSKIPLLVLLFLGSALLDVVSLALLVPYLGLFIDSRLIEVGVIGEILDRFEPSLPTRSVLIGLGLFLVIVSLLKGILGFLITRRILGFSWEQQRRLRVELMSSYLNMPYQKYLQRNMSEYISTVIGLTASFSTGVVMTGLKVLSDAFIAVAIFVVLVIADPVALGILLVLIVAVIFGYDKIFKRRLRKHGEKAALANEMASQAINDGIRGFKEIRILGADNIFINVVGDATKRYGQSEVYKALIVGMPKYLFESVLFLFVVGFASFKLLEGQSGAQIIPMLTLFGIGAIRLLPASQSLARSLIEFRYNRFATQRLYLDVLSAPEGRVIKKGNDACVTRSDEFDTLEMRSVGFRYEGALNPIFRNISFEIRVGDSIGIMGASGAGKTTIIDLILGLLDPSDGEILVNGTPLKQQLAHWQSQVAYLPQDVFLIDDTLQNNITLGLGDIGDVDEERVNKAVRQAQLTSLVQELPHGLSTRIGDRGMRLSGGQRQRIAIARALYQGRKILVLDEATSALDKETEAGVVEQVGQLRGQVTLIVIAHRVSTLQRCRAIYCLEDGKMKLMSAQ
jgi:ATP-binding cassette, subfamily B, bacterial PglK